MVKVHLLDVNDNYPMFPAYRLVNVNFSSDGIEGEEPIFEVYDRIEENAKLNTRITQLRAVDLDKQANITYMIVHSSSPLDSQSRRMLSIDKFTGIVYYDISFFVRCLFDPVCAFYGLMVIYQLLDKRFEARPEC